MKRRIYNIEGVIQGVGFRPTLYCYAVDHDLGGWIRNCSGKVELAIEGTIEELEYFMEKLNLNLPHQARIDSLKLVIEEEIIGKTKFLILESEKGSESKISIPADLAMCKDCENEILNPKDRRFGYPFTTCINCGPRYTVVNSMPYDRCRTTLVSFPLCSECEKEYNNPRNRRFHAESTACSVCGPKLWIADCEGKTVNEMNPIDYTVEELNNGKIAAIRGIGGYLLAVDAFSNSALNELRKRKNRPDKPFAVMVRDLNIAEKYCLISQKERKALESSAAPIVILDIKNNTVSVDHKQGTKNVHSLPMHLLSPDTDTLGVMLPYTPLHKLLFHNSDFEFLVMTSGNRGGEPICIENEEAFERLNGIADFFLCHNREINLRNDDSLCILQGSEMQIWRRARGYAPDLIRLNIDSNQSVLAMGAELKNTICVLTDNEAVISPHIGDLESPEAVDALIQVVNCFPEFLNKTPDLIAVDNHPDMHSTKIGKKKADNNNISLVEVQHHFAHAASCMAENNLTEALALVLDGTGLGNDGNIWGAELLYCKLSKIDDLDNSNNTVDGSQQQRYTRIASFTPAPLPGGDAAVYHPIRQLIARLILSGIIPDKDFLKVYNISESEYKIWKMQIDQKINTPITHAAGRLFDAFSSLLKIAPDKITYEGQGAIRLEAYAKRVNLDRFKYRKINIKTYIKDDMLFVDWNNVFAEMYKNKVWKLNVKDKEECALTFHYIVAEAAVEMVKFGLKREKIKNICLSGGVFMNRILTSILNKQLEDAGLKVFQHKKVPPNDGGISLGQSVIAISKLN